MIIKINNDNKVISKASGKIFDKIAVNNVTSFRVDDVPNVTEAEELYFNPETKEFYTQEKPVIKKLSDEDYKAICEAKQNEQKALRWLADNDWKPNKIVTGEWSRDDVRWINYLIEREKMRAQLDEATAVLQSIK